MSDLGQPEFRPRQLNHGLIERILNEEKALPNLATFAIDEIAKTFGESELPSVREKCLRTPWCCDHYVHRENRIMQSRELSNARYEEADRTNIERRLFQEPKLPMEYLFSYIEAAYFDQDVIEANNRRFEIYQYFEKLQAEGVHIGVLEEETDGNFGFPEFEHVSAVRLLYNAYFSQKHFLGYNSSGLLVAEHFWIESLHPKSMSDEKFQLMIWKTSSASFKLNLE